MPGSKRTWKTHIGIRSSPERLREWYRIYRRKNSKRINARIRAWKKANRNKIRISNRRYREANREKVREVSRRWWQSGSPAVERKKQKSAARKRANPLLRSMHEASRRSKTRGVWVDYRLILQRDSGVCGICGGPVAPDDLEFDHIMPLARGGIHMESNIQVAHGICNRRKYAKVA